MHLLPGHDPLVVFRRGNSEGLHSLDQAVLEQFGSPDCAVSLLREHENDIVQLPGVLGQRPLMQVGEQQHGAGNDRANK